MLTLFVDIHPNVKILLTMSLLIFFFSYLRYYYDDVCVVLISMLLLIFIFNCYLLTYFVYLNPQKIAKKKVRYESDL